MPHLPCVLFSQLLRVDAAVNVDVQPAPALSYSLVSPHEHFRMVPSTGELELIDEVSESLHSEDESATCALELVGGWGGPARKRSQERAGGSATGMNVHFVTRVTCTCTFCDVGLKVDYENPDHEQFFNLTVQVSNVDARGNRVSLPLCFLPRCVTQICMWFDVLFFVMRLSLLSSLLYNFFCASKNKL